jgi:hypothetical protein
MNVGMMWWDGSSLSLVAKIQKAIDYYQKKYGRKPDVCLVHPSMMEKDQTRVEVDKLTVRPYHAVLPNHIWIGIEDKQESA